MEKIECQICGWIGSEGDFEAPWSDIEPCCPECMGGNFLDLKGNSLKALEKQIEKINLLTAKINCIERKLKL